MAGHDHDDWPRLGSGTSPTEDPDFGLGHIVSVEVYIAVFLSLIALTAITVRVAYLPFSDTVHLFVAMGIATVKAAVVTLMFMHLLYESKIIWGIVIYPLFIFVLILAGTLGDAGVKRPAYPGSLYTESKADQTMVHQDFEQDATQHRPEGTANPSH